MASRQKYLLDVDDIVRQEFFGTLNANATIAGLSENATLPLTPNAGGLGNNVFVDGTTLIYSAELNKFVSSGDLGAPDNFDDLYYRKAVIDGRFEGVSGGGKYQVDWSNVLNKNATQIKFMAAPPRIFNKGDFPGNQSTINFTSGRVALFDWTTYNLADYDDLTGKTPISALLSYQISLSQPDDDFLRFLAGRKDSGSPQVLMSVARCSGSSDNIGFGGMSLLPCGASFDLRLAAGGTGSNPSATTLLGLGSSSGRAYMVIDLVGYFYT